MIVFKKGFHISLSFIIFWFLIFIIALLLILFLFDVLTGPKWESVIPGLLTGFIIAIFQAFLSWYEFKEMDEYHELKIRKILPDRKNPLYYGNLISKARKEIKIQGVTAERFLRDFANDNPNAPGNEKLLFQAFARNVKVTLLIANKDWLDSEDDKLKAAAAEPKLKSLSDKYTDSFQYTEYEHAPTHSIVMIDEECIVGPIFPNISSMYTPAIHLKNDSQFAKYYVEYFDNEWNRWKNSQKK
ncbi:MAG: hypothetical protein ACXW0Q_11725 [Methylovulum sp.]